MILNSAGEVTFTLHVKDDVPGGTPIFNRATVVFPSVPEITPTNATVNYVQPVTALPQKIETNYIIPKPVTLQGLDVGGLPLTFTVTQKPFYGSLSGTAPNLVYTPDENVTGLDRFTYVSSNGVSQSESAEVSITILPSSNDTQAPEILWTFPAEDATGIPYRISPALTDTEGSIYAPFPIIQFSEAMDVSSINTVNLTLRDSLSNPVALTAFYDQLTNQATLYPRTHFVKGMSYTVTVSSGVLDRMGNDLGTAYNFSFTIGEPFETNTAFMPVIMR